MKLLAITCWCGDQFYADMTAKMLTGLVASLYVADLDDWKIGVLSQGTTPDAVLTFPKAKGRWALVSEAKNKGFAFGMNGALLKGLAECRPDVVLCLNNDIEMPYVNWLKELLAELQDDAVLCPMTNYTSTTEQRAKCPQDRDAFFHGVTPGLCWLMPWPVVKAIQEHLGGRKLFPEDLGGRAWGEDNYTAGVVRTKVNRRPFKIVPRSWIRHLGAKTSCKISAEEKMRCHKEAQRRMKAEGFK